MRKFEEYYVAFWCLTMPITSFLILPVQGTTIAYMMALASMGLVLLKIRDGMVPPQVASYFKYFALAIITWVLLLCGSQIADLLNPQVGLQGMFALSGENSMLFRSSMFTQSLYLLACVMIALYFRFFLPEAWMKHVYLGAWLFSIYGLYDWTFYLIFHQSGDFLANRTFGQGDHPGSWSQTLDFGGVQLLRLKSTLGEPSFVSVVVVPYLFMAIEGKKRLLAFLLLVAAILSTSTTVFGSLLICFLIQSLWSNKSRRTSISVLGITVFALILFSLTFPDVFRFLFTDKLSGDTESGRNRLDNIENFKQLFGEFGLLNWIFGVGFGYVYFSLLWSLTANDGLVGVGIFLYLFLKSAYLLPRAEKSEWLKIATLSIVVAVAITLTELFTPTTWMFLGLAFRRLDQLKYEREVYHATLRAPVDLTPELSLTDSRG